MSAKRPRASARVQGSPQADKDELRRPPGTKLVRACSSRRVVKDEPRFRRRPPSSTRAGVAIRSSIALTGLRPRRPLRRCFRHEECRSRRSNRSVLLLALLLLFLRGLGLLRFLRHAALLAVSEWRCRAVRIDVHCTSISTAANEKIRISLTKCER